MFYKDKESEAKSMLFRAYNSSLISLLGILIFKIVIIGYCGIFIQLVSIY